ncbi:MAG: hypothetical protein D6820_08735 [Lentisphaerae bacterium]|nr:MAG: hypothetical protein D6820_08735 [Lentisphaerota bacterium]
MISISFGLFFSVFTLMIVWGLVGLWIVDSLRQIRKYWEPAEYKIINCPQCHYKFFIFPRHPQAQCPACGQVVHPKIRKQKHLKY